MKSARLLFVISSLTLAFILVPSVYASPSINFGHGGPQFQYVTKNNAAPLTSAHPNWHVEIHLPQNGATIIEGVLSDANFTALKNNVATMAVENIFTTTASPNLDYCSTAKYILENQDGYLDRVYNKTSGLDNTWMVYPAYCYPETGANPIDGAGLTPTPEYMNGIALFSTLAIGMTVILLGSKRLERKW